MMSDRTHVILRTGKRVLVAGVFLLTIQTVTGSANAGMVQTPHLTRFQAAKAPNGARDICRRYSWACSNRAGGKITSDDDILAVARKINSRVNRKIRPVSDQRLFGVSERWTLPTSGAGDCEDYALLKLKQLIDAGVPPNRMFLAQVLSPRLRQHVVLVVRTRSGDYVLDNLTSRIKTWRKTGHTFLKMQNASNARKWDAVLLGPRARRF